MAEHDQHRFALNGRKELVMEGVQHVASFDESEITLETSLGTVILKGEGLHITQLNLDTGKSKGKGVLTRFLK